MKSASIQRSLVEQVSAFLLALPRKQQGSFSKTDSDNTQASRQ